MKELNDATVFYAFSASNQPVLRIHGGEQVRIRTKDCFGNQLTQPTDVVDQIDWDAINPATGPVFVEGAQPGDVLKVSIDRLEIDSRSAMITGEAEGTCGDLFTDGLHLAIKDVIDNKLIWQEGVELECKPMIGVIGVAPADGQSINCGTPGPHGGNMDNTMIGQGATLYFPVAAEGALFGCGDFHAVMGDGEIGVCGGEIPGYATLTLDVLHDRSITNPVLENEDSFATIASAETLDQACSQAVHDMVAILSERCQGITKHDLVMLLSLCGDVQVCQIVDPLKTARFVVPKHVLAGLGFTW